MLCTGRRPVWWSEWRSHSRGALLIEVLIALAVLGVISTVFIGAMYTSLQAARVTDERSAAITLARSQIEFVKGQRGYSETDWDYTVTTAGWTATAPPTWLAGKPSTYVQLPAEYGGYAVTVTGDSDPPAPYKLWEDGESMRLLTATVLHEGATVYTLNNYQLDRYFEG